MYEYVLSSHLPKTSPDSSDPESLAKVCQVNFREVLLAIGFEKKLSERIILYKWFGRELYVETNNKVMLSEGTNTQLIN